MEWFLKCMRNYATFDGRARRKEYWMFWLISTVIGCGVGMLVGATGLPPALANLVGLAFLLPTISVGIRRMHDIGKSGWYIGIFYIAVTLCGIISGLLKIYPSLGLGLLGGIIGVNTVIYLIYYLVLLCRDGDKGENKYGPDPKAGLAA